ncbi:CRISPR-associated endoribonuclease Cas6 [Listeria booriae]|uniref:Uncharacterized protein n=1 Tax=Listeria booriae TaxID=1552123 RepID=A0A099W6M6_9LIST|nr:CRISPR-associated endoribonuclease Cas6 [Listeria booriae]KGL39780.1 hypothetical protein EP57_12010 [Listeria booriae]MBC1907079.1 CRISPR-associated endoribonuclease Cas6 [Listeria booriae]MBC1912689.1 CRISPR-associated endoribonuclease Cas6 [Listeria booriae]MBC2024514.1 CRISPR-associated endoribonuclease Cas6 [Listeria booriae]MBC2047663.1 CRISPR-associated endoribonuclease Cas6 [Listeria booriae]
MRLKIMCDLSNEKFPLNFRRKILMVFKTGLKKAYPEVFEDLYGANRQKDFTFAVYFQDAVFGKEDITVKGKRLIINFSTGNAEQAIMFYNAFMKLRREQIKISDVCQLEVKSVDMVRIAPIETKSIVLHTLSPIVCRDHNRETQKDWFYMFEDEQFIPILKRNLRIKLEGKYGSFIAQDIENMKIKPINMKKTVAQHYDISIVCSLGLIEIEAEKYLLEHIVESGFGALTGMGFGMLAQQ